jgi:dTDP-4-amino-4,6-dideoxygalactose transaminase
VGAVPVLVDVTDDYTIDLQDLERKAASSGAKTLLLSHMRGHICDMPALMAICQRHGVQVVEDCAHTMGASWAGKATGTWGRVGCFSLQSYKHANAGEGGLLITDDEDVAAQAVLFSGSYMLYRSHTVRPSDEVFERWKYQTPNFSLRMSNLAAAVVRPQLGAVLTERCQRWNQRYRWMAEALGALPHVRMPARPNDEQFVASSIQFSLTGLSREQVVAVLAACAQRGLHIKWFGADEPVGFTSVWTHWRYFGQPQSLPQAERVLSRLCDMRLPLTLGEADCQAMASVLRDSLNHIGSPALAKVAPAQTALG